MLKIKYIISPNLPLKFIEKINKLQSKQFVASSAKWRPRYSNRF